MCFRVNSKYANTKICKIHKRECEFRAARTPDPGVGKWPMCTHSAHLAPPSFTCQVGEIGCCWLSSFSGNIPSL